jgi:hypothetical protein
LQPEKLPEVDISILIGVMKESFQVLVWDPTANKPWFIKLVGSPYKPADPNCRHLDVPFDRQTRKVCPLVLRQVLNKFHIEIVDFVQALADYSTVEKIPVEIRKKPTAEKATGSEG